MANFKISNIYSLLVAKLRLSNRTLRTKNQFLSAFSCIVINSQAMGQQLTGWDQYVTNPNIKTDALVIFQNNQIIYEKYNHQFNNQTKHLA